jgi:hypothetical protein
MSAIIEHRRIIGTRLFRARPKGATPCGTFFVLQLFPYELIIKFGQSDFVTILLSGPHHIFYEHNYASSRKDNWKIQLQDYHW